ncbi:MAG: hypothetical protein OEZ35_04570 [Candidatus Bathyarchaeota archaeon]|nr:hypothetical protein [Candidatus Bathyarchaeota archaeon]
MKTRKEHNLYCETKSIDREICDLTNEWMDEPARKGGGCAHRKQRHSSVDCLKWSLTARNLPEARERYRACQIHREADRKTDRCGSKSLHKSK